MNGYIPPNKLYFDKQIPEEDEVFIIPNEIHNKHETLEKIFEEYFDVLSIQTAKVINTIKI